MESQEYEKAFKNEETNWYYLSRQNFFFKLIKKYSKKTRNKILDVGSGAGVILKRLGSYGDAVGMDSSEEAINFCKKRGLNCKMGFAEKIPFNDGEFDIVTVFGVIEHLEDDVKGLQEIRRVCKKGGLIFLECPAYKFLWSSHDIALHHKRRYTIKELRRKLTEEQFKIKKINHIYSLLFIPAAILRLIRRASTTKKNRSDPFEKVPEFLNKLLLLIELLESKIIEKIDLPFGVSIVCVAENEQKK